jgi:hypothetical protein
MTNKKDSKLEKPLYSNQSERTADSQVMSIGLARFEKAKIELETKGILSIQEEGYLKSINKIIKHIKEDKEKVLTELLDNFELEDNQLLN